jgi:DNA repair protein RecO (recombination protein O)
VAGAPLLTPALVLGAVRYGETSRIVRLATRDLGVVSAIAKGALRPRSRFGASLQLLSEGQAHLIASRSSDLHTLAAFDLRTTHSGLAGHLERFAAANALAELAVRFVPPMANPALFDLLVREVALLELAPADAIEVVAIRALWRLVTELGLGLRMSHCVRDGAQIPDGAVALSLRDGGFLCRNCTREGVSTRLGVEDRAALEALAGDGDDLPLLEPAQGAAHRRLLWRWVREHLGDGAMPALEAWQGDPRSRLDMVPRRAAT